MVQYLTGSEEKDRELTKEAMRLWRISSYDYRKAEEKYRRLTEEKKSLGITFRCLPSSVEKQRPRLPFLMQQTETEAKLFLETLDLPGKRRLIREITGLSNHYSYNTFRSYVRDLNAVVERKKNLAGKSWFNLSPNYATPYFEGTHRTSQNE